MDDLGVDILKKILLVLNPSIQDLCKLSTLSKRFREASYSPELWVDVELNCYGNTNVYNWGLEMMAERMKNAISLSFFGIHFPDRPSPWIHFGLQTILNGCGPHSLRILKLDYVCQVPFSDLLLTNIGKTCPHLEDFTLSATNYFSADSAVASFIRSCPELKKFRYYVKESHPLHTLSDNILWQISKKLPEIQVLELNGQNMTENGLFALEDCKELSRLGLHGYKRGVFECANTQPDEKLTLFERVEELLFSQMLPSPSEIRRIIRMCPRLRKLELNAEEGDEHMKANAERIHSFIEKDFPGIDCVCGTASHVCAEELTAAQLAKKLIDKKHSDKGGNLTHSKVNGEQRSSASSSAMADEDSGGFAGFSVN